MSRITLDCTGLACPKPVLRVKDALALGASHIEVTVDNVASKENIFRFARSHGYAATGSDGPDGRHTISITATGEPVDLELDTSDYQCAIPTSSEVVYVIASDSMGRGSEELGWALLQTYIQTIQDVQPLPKKILLYNSGVKLVTVSSGALDALLHLQEQGVEIFVCGTCLDFFKLKSAIKVGHISNMYEIMHAMISADKVVSPF
ncbi:sulfurtransferase-like selenium metabolism protein YedF [Desulfobulbus oligotrophicus]|jgi:selenium metabolism protein YedF|uniref:Sulfurtransferase-like selenium metabolism protein YedF n=1 Tax=Desulfobulbus oligotrophicus TaxID=1909699 RepID=A0A7T5VCD1_9BACT|nr:sulfurtransferase-like selenium metabolism protein YedF [Desulfobulbus oligotrophicus]MDY0391215.1 sulfurtransferase-like selenium metabolism protein YedF [Desulfobulbus oligotrophicus]QQG65284.1 sulfurtransferase-like selenium metabolism protein YedF [Desulfobulbus oligotrophicus]